MLRTPANRAGVTELASALEARGTVEGIELEQLLGKHLGPLACTVEAT
ncbi:MAG: hypothetical protein ACREMF_03110 [Gemmatimonadales bacterium]